MRIVQRIDELLLSKGIKPAQMSRDLGFSSGLYSQWRKGLQNPSRAKLKDIAEYLDVSVDFLVTGAEAESNIQLSEDESELLKTYRNLSFKGKAIVLAKAIEESRLEASAELSEVKNKIG